MTSRSTLVFSLSVSLLVATTASAQPANEGSEVSEVEAEGGEDQYEYEVPGAPVDEITTPGYQDPDSGQRPQRPRRYRIPYQEGMEIPPGGQVIERRRLGLAISGTVLFGVPYLLTVITWTIDARRGARGEGAMLVPVLGPVIVLAQLSIEGLRWTGPQKFGMASNGIMQFVGVTMMIFGFMRKSYLEYYAEVNDRKLAFRLMPFASRAGGGASLGVTF
jgi:hypothetical protein